MKRSLLVLFALFLILSGCSATYAGNNVSSTDEQIDYYQLAEKYAGEKNFSKAAEYYTIAYEQGNEDGAGKLCCMYLLGMGVNKDMDIAAKMCQVAANNGNIPSQHSLGLMYLRGAGVKRDTRQAVKWLSEAAEKGFFASQIMLGVIYTVGKLYGEAKLGLEQDCAKGIHWLNLAARERFHEALLGLGMLYHNGECVEQDYYIAYNYFTQAALPLPSDKKRSGDITTGYDKTGNPYAQYALGIVYGLGYGTDINHEQAFYWLSKAAEQGEVVPQALRNLAIHYESGIAVGKDLKKAEELRAKADEITRKKEAEPYASVPCPGNTN